MPNPTPIYIIKADSHQLPGYCQEEDLPLSMRTSSADIIGRTGGTLSRIGADMRSVSIRMRLLSRLSNTTGLLHLKDIKDQWREGISALDDLQGPCKLYIGDTTRYLNAEFQGASMPLVAGTSDRATYTVTFLANPPYFLGTTVSGSSSVSGSTTISVAIGDTRKTYPIITIGSGITAIAMSHSGSGKEMVLSSMSGSAVTVNCASLQITQGGSNAARYLTSTPDFGMSFVGSGTFSLDITAVSGSGNVLVEMQPRYVR